MKALHLHAHLVAGVDEAGRGPLAGPVVAAAVILPTRVFPGLGDIGDSKELPEKVRDLTAVLIKKHAIAWGIGEACHEEIDKYNILQATYIAMHRAIDALNIRPISLWVDGNRFKSYPGIPHLTFVKGDSLHKSIGAASILAKVHRDALMKRLHEDHPEYGWDKNKGYPTPSHRAVVRSLGPTPYHRKTFLGNIGGGLFDSGL